MWKPIETAPKDGSGFLAWNEPLRIVEIAWYGKSVAHTLWMPLPAPPALDDNEAVRLITHSATLRTALRNAVDLIHDYRSTGARDKDFEWAVSLVLLEAETALKVVNDQER